MVSCMRHGGICGGIHVPGEHLCIGTTAHLQEINILHYPMSSWISVYSPSLLTKNGIYFSHWI